jgi:hypothetical protein
MFALVLRGDRGAVLRGHAEAGTFGSWSLATRPGKTFADLRVTGERLDPYLGLKPPTGIRIHFPARATGADGVVTATRARPGPAPAAPDDQQAWWTWRSVRREAPGHYVVEGLPEVS